MALIAAYIDIISTNHAPHLLEEKQRDYLHSGCGPPTTHHFFIVMLEFVMQRKITM